jgi:hypothetical protein
MKQKTNYYVDNKLFLKEISAYRKAVRRAKRNKEPKPRVPEYIGKCFMLIAENMSHKYNFLSYTFRDEMVADAIENCIMYVDNFDPAKSKNPFAYFTQICYYAFLRRIQREKKQLYVKYKSTEMHGVLDDFDQLDDGDGHSRQFEMYDNIGEFIQKFETAKAAKKAKVKAKGLEKFLE